MTRKQKRILKRKLEKLAEKILFTIGIFLTVWFLISYIEVIKYSLDTNHQYWEGNIFVEMTNDLE